MRILAIETSCDETSIAIADFNRRKIRVSSHIILSQIPVHKKFGGVVPNLAKREHQRNLAPILLTALREARLRNPKFQIPNSKPIQNLKSKFQNLKTYKLKNLETILEREPELRRQFIKRVAPLAPPPIDAIAVTYGPGLAPALWVGVNFARALAYLWKKPLIPVNHMAGHLYSAILQKNPKSKAQNPKQITKDKNIKISKPILDFEICVLDFPALALLVSGGHTELVLMRGHGKFKIIGETLDDAAGEAFDKVARILGLSYPGGPAISQEAEQKSQIPNHKSQTNSKPQIPNSKQRIALPRPMLNSKDHNFSFSGLKTAVLYLTRDLGPKRTKKLRPLIAKEFQNAVVEVLVKKTIRAAKEYKAKTILLGGGVAANKLLRETLESRIQNQESRIRFLPCELLLAGDNALMIAASAYFSGKKTAWRKLRADANLRLS